MASAPGRGAATWLSGDSSARKSALGTELELGVPDASVGHHDGLAAPAGTEHLDVPLHGAPGVGHDEVRRHPGGAVPGCGGLGRGGERWQGGLGHDDSFGKRQGTLDAGAQAGGEFGIGLDGGER